VLLVIDNYDSFTYNLVHYLRDINVATIRVEKNDSISVQQILKLKPSHILLSPGPCTPNEAGVCLSVVALAIKHDIPLLGVCLGHQAIAQAMGGEIIRTKPMHGKVDKIRHNNNSIMFDNIPHEFSATRYHSLSVKKSSLPTSLKVTASNKDDIIMALEHKQKPIYGLQFHPESIVSQFGHDLLRNFYEKNLST
jgi:anthranilate synthase/aminodeoxychorismate synthase-like glutamine amidotransferase